MITSCNIDVDVGGEVRRKECKGYNKIGYYYELII